VVCGRVEQNLNFNFKNDTNSGGSVWKDISDTK
jgi:hypothetical protein